MVILALDQATTTGWAVVDEKGFILDSGVWHLADRKRTGESRGMRYLRLRACLHQAIQQWDPDVIVHEQTLLRGGDATEIANGLKAVILMTAAVYGVEVSCVHTSELKHWATGDGKADKDAMVRAAEGFRLLQWKGTGNRPLIDDNEADATLIGLWASSKFGAFQGPSWPNKKKTRKRSGS
jgi:Holliday junction resolvasome RuvABC endonuclease subunit